jgi:hypothetical protein
LSENNPEKLLGKGPEIDQNAFAPLNPTLANTKSSSGPVYTTVSQKKRYITISGIESDTSCQEYQWPEFGIKELGDNASDFHKVSYPNATANERKIAIKLIIDTITGQPF